MILQLGALFLLGTVSFTTALPPCTCTRVFHPVCGSNGKTYSSECMLNCAQLTDSDLVMVRTGRCDHTDLSDSCICTLQYDPICGTDGRTYSNECSLNCARRSVQVEIDHRGPCSRRKREDVKVAGIEEVKVAGIEEVKVAAIPSCTCPRNRQPVCGTDGTTYANICLLNCARSINPGLELQHVDACGNSVVDTPCSCAREFVPVCGTDHNTYDNLCMLRCAKYTNENLEVQHAGECQTNEITIPNCSCTREKRPVCGTDGNTYSNPCMLNCARENNEELHIEYEGYCDNRVKVVEVADNTPSCSCTRNLQPVCASNGVTFSNECLMRCAGTHLTIEREGPCELY